MFQAFIACILQFDFIVHIESFQLPVMIAFYSRLICWPLISFNFAVDYLLFIVRDVSVNPNPDEVADIKYVNQDELKELLRKADAGEEGLKLSPWFRLVVDNFLFKWWDHVEKGTLEEAADMKAIHKLTWGTLVSSAALFQ